MTVHIIARLAEKNKKNHEGELQHSGYGMQYYIMQRKTTSRQLPACGFSREGVICGFPSGCAARSAACSRAGSDSGSDSGYARSGYSHGCSA